MSRGIIRQSLVSTVGPLALGAIYRRAALHERFGGNTNAGAVPSNKEPVVLLFHTHEKTHQFYEDGFDDDGVYWFSGMGALGDMDWNYVNRAIRDHEKDGRDLLLFERVQRKGGYWRFTHLMYCIGYKEETRSDREGKPRRAIVFGLVSVDESVGNEVSIDVNADLVELRRLALHTDTEPGVMRTRVSTVRMRSAAVRAYALYRAAGVCEACDKPAPFIVSSGEPFLEVHHIDRLADGGPDRPDRVAGVCPNCHRRCHHGLDARAFNDSLRRAVRIKEEGMTTAP